MILISVCSLDAGHFGDKCCGKDMLSAYILPALVEKKNTFLAKKIYSFDFCLELKYFRSSYFT